MKILKENEYIGIENKLSKLPDTIFSLEDYLVNLSRSDSVVTGSSKLQKKFKEAINSAQEVRVKLLELREEYEKEFLGSSE